MLPSGGSERDDAGHEDAQLGEDPHDPNDAEQPGEP